MKGKFKRWWSTIPSISTKQTTIVISDIKPREIMTCHLKIFSGNLIQNLYILYIYLHLIKITSLTCSPFWHVTVCQIWRNTTTVTCQWSYVYSLLTCHSVPDLKKHHYSHMPEWSYVYSRNHIDGVMVSVPPSSAVDHVFEPRSGQTKEYKIGICCLSTKHAALWKKSKDQG